MRYLAIPISFIVVAGLAGIGGHCSAAQTTTPAASPTVGDPLAVVEAWVAGHQAAQHDPHLLAPDAILEVPGAPPLAGADAIVAFLDAFYGAIGERDVAIETAVASGGQVAGLLRIRGTHADPIFGVPPTGNRLDVLLAAFVDVEGGRIARIRTVFDSLGLMTQLGAIPGAETPAA